MPNTNEASDHRMEVIDCDICLGTSIIFVSSILFVALVEFQSFVSCVFVYYWPGAESSKLMK